MIDALARRTLSFNGVLVTVGALVVPILTIRGLPEALAARDDQSVPGVFTAERERCERSGRTFSETCHWYGTFVSDDGTVERRDVRMDETFERPGQSRPTQVLDA